MSLGLRDSILILESAGKTIERNVVKEQIGVNTMASMFGSIMGPPAESEYPVEPVCVAIITPSASSFAMG